MKSKLQLTSAVLNTVVQNNNIHINDSLVKWMEVHFSYVCENCSTLQVVDLLICNGDICATYAHVCQCVCGRVYMASSCTATVCYYWRSGAMSQPFNYVIRRRRWKPEFLDQIAIRNCPLLRKTRGFDTARLIGGGYRLKCRREGGAEKVQCLSLTQFSGLIMCHITIHHSYTRQTDSWGELLIVMWLRSTKRRNQGKYWQHSQ